MRSNFSSLARLAGAMTLTAICAMPVFADEVQMQQHCEAQAMRFKAADVSHVTPERIEAARRQATFGERLCKSEPKIGLKAIDLALRDIGDTAI
jgi:hypothetical protein